MTGGLSHTSRRALFLESCGLRTLLVAATAFFAASLVAPLPASAQSEATPPQKPSPARTITTAKALPALRADTATKGPTEAPKHQNLLRGVKSWGYQLQGTDPQTVARSPYDLMVIDYTRGGAGAEPYSRADVARMQRKADGSRRFLLAYISIGEAEDYRFYWRNNWVETLDLAPEAPPAPTQATDDPTPPNTAAPEGTTKPARRYEQPKPRKIRIPNLMAPTWLGRESEAWSGNFAVRYWDTGWQSIIFGTRRSYLERIIAAGFDGVYIDRADAYYPLLQLRPGAERDMAQFVIRLAKHARAIKPDFLIVPQNAEELLLRPDYLAQIDAIAKEDLFYGGFGDGVENSWLQIRTSLGWLSETQKREIPVFAIEYLDDPKLIAASRKRLARQNFIAYFGPRALNTLANPKDWEPPAATQNAKHKCPRNGQLNRFSFAADAACSSRGTTGTAKTE